jgi:hypothetical protein
MARTISLNMRNALYAQTTNEVPICLITLWHPDYPGTMRISTDPTTRISDAPLKYATNALGAWYYFYPVMITLPDDIDERAPRARIAIENISRDLVALVRSVATPGRCDMKVVLSATPNTVEVDYPDMDILSSQYNDEILTIEVGLNALDQEPYPAGTFVPAGFPGLFA